MKTEQESNAEYYAHRVKTILDNGNPQRPGACFAYSGDSEFGTRDAIIATKHRDSDCPTRANFDAIERDLMAEFPDLVHSEEFSHWAVGWTLNLIVRIVDISDNPIEYIIDRIDEIKAGLADYPVYDEDLWSQYESELVTEYIASEIGSAMYRYVDPDKPIAVIRMIDSVTEFDLTEPLAFYVMNHLNSYGENELPDSDTIDSILESLTLAELASMINLASKTDQFVESQGE